MVKLSDISLGTFAHDNVSGVKGKITAKCERISGEHSVALEGVDTTGRPYIDWVELPRLVLDGNVNS